MAAIDPLHQFKIVTVVPGPTFHVGNLAVDMSITNVTLSMLIAAGLVTLLFAVLSIRPKVVPGRLQVVGEGLFGLIDDLAASIMGEESVKFFPFIFALFSFILVMNMLGLFIFFHTATSQLAVTATLAILTILTVIIVGFLRNGLGFFKLFVPSGVPWPLLFLLVPIEFISFLMRPLTLALRLFGNMLGGHIVMNIFASFVVSLGGLAALGGLGYLGLPAAGVTFGAVLALITLEFVVAFLQAFVFAALTCVYLNDVVNLHKH
jgi:F-type H+-transporting ATPase subunit a